MSQRKYDFRHKCVIIIGMMSTHIQPEPAFPEPRKSAPDVRMREGEPPHSPIETQAENMIQRMGSELKDLSYDDWLKWLDRNTDTLKQLRSLLEGYTINEIAALTEKYQDVLQIIPWCSISPIIESYHLSFSAPPNIQKPDRFSWLTHDWVRKNALHYIDKREIQIAEECKEMYYMLMGENSSYFWKIHHLEMGISDTAKQINRVFRTVSLLSGIGHSSTLKAYDEKLKEFEKEFSYKIATLQDRILRYSMGCKSIELPTRKECDELFEDADRKFAGLLESCRQQGVTPKPDPHNLERRKI